MINIIIKRRVGRGRPGAHTQTEDVGSLCEEEEEEYDDDDDDDEGAGEGEE